MEELKRQLSQERELADRLAVELSALNNILIFNERSKIIEVLELWEKMRKKENSYDR
jgi:hypothetical protein